MKSSLIMIIFIKIVITLRTIKDIIPSLLNFPEKKLILQRNFHTPYLGINKKTWENTLTSMNGYYYKDPFPYYGPPITFEKIIENKNKKFISPVVIRESFQPKEIIISNTTTQRKNISIINNNSTNSLTLDESKEKIILNTKTDNNNANKNTSKKTFLSFIPLRKSNEEDDNMNE